MPPFSCSLQAASHRIASHRIASHRIASLFASLRLRFSPAVAKCAQPPSEATDARLLRSRQRELPDAAVERAALQVESHQFRIA